MMSDSKERVGIICHDAGGAELLSSYVRQNNLAYYYCIEGPAVQVFERKVGPVQSWPLQQTVSKANWILCGTSWQSDVEWHAFGMARQHGKRSVAFLDHWVNYRQRFERNGITNLPDTIWVGDSYALSLAEKEFPDIPVVLVENPYLAEIKKEFQKIDGAVEREKGSHIILFVSDNLDTASLKQHGDANFFGYTDREVLEFLIENLSVFKKKKNKIIIRPHPSESIEKYQWAKDVHGELIELGGQLTLLEEIAASDIVAGGDSMALVIALFCGRPVVNCIPPSGSSSMLPFKEIKRMQDMISCSFE